MSIKVEDRTYDELVGKSELPVLVDLWAPWCGPCRAIAPVLEEIAEERRDSLVVAKINVDENPESTMKFGVTSIPTMVLVKGGQVLAEHVGGAPKAALLEWVDESLAKG